MTWLSIVYIHQIYAARPLLTVNFTIFSIVFFPEERLYAFLKPELNGTVLMCNYKITRD